jgi:hypothetical protein
MRCAPRRAGARWGASSSGFSQADRPRPEPTAGRGRFPSWISQTGGQHAQLHAPLLLPSGRVLDNSVVSANVGAGNFYSCSRAADIGAEWRQSDRTAIAGRSQVLDPRKNAGGQAGNADGPRDAAGWARNFRAERSARRRAGPAAADSAQPRQQPVRGFGSGSDDIGHQPATV